MAKFNWQLAVLNTTIIVLLMFIGAGILVPLAILYAIFFVDYSTFHHSKQ